MVIFVKIFFMKKIGLVLLFFSNLSFSQVVTTSVPDIYDFEDSLNKESITSFRWDTLYIRNNLYHKGNIVDDTLKICLLTPKYPDFYPPIYGKVISEFGWRGRRVHTGIDIKLNKGDTVRCSFDGIVRISRYFSGYGNIVVVRHYNGIETVYAHLSRRLVNVNDSVKSGQPIGLGGRTGRATTDHLHFETRYNEQPFNPRLLIDFDNYTLNSDTLLLTNNSFKFNKGKSNYNSNNNKLTFDSNKHVHIVQKGDTLYSLAKKYNTTVDALCEANKIKQNDILKLGQRLLIP